ncbi:MAG: single-stranded DNA-binding protein [Mollicutes bacterium PWAP]|nr:single-stranded DNA-binding protein [Mollicutes bacterium PWAP]
MNKVLIVGRVVKSLEPKKTTSGISYVRFTVAVSREYNRDLTDFIPVVAWRKTSDFASQYLTKGMQIGITGSFQSSTYQDKNGQNTTRYEVSVDNIELLDTRRYNNPNVSVDNTQEVKFENKTNITKEIPIEIKKETNSDVPWDIDL